MTPNDLRAGRYATARRYGTARVDRETWLARIESRPRVREQLSAALNEQAPMGKREQLVSSLMSDGLPRVEALRCMVRLGAAHSEFASTAQTEDMT